jgi:hypothetical protein
MEPTVTAEPDELCGVRLDELRRASEIYLRLAYPSGTIPEVVRRRLIWNDGCTVAVLLSGPPFERAGRASGRPAPIYALRLGNHRYAHMKLQIQPWPNEAGFMLSVNTHDQVTAAALNSVGAEAFQQLQAENQRLKESIEETWDHAGLPTFLRYLRDYIKSRGATPSPDGFPERPQTDPGRLA